MILSILKVLYWLIATALVFPPIYILLKRHVRSSRDVIITGIMILLLSGVIVGLAVYFATNENFKNENSTINRLTKPEYWAPIIAFVNATFAGVLVVVKKLKQFVQFDAKNTFGESKKNQKSATFDVSDKIGFMGDVRENVDFIIKFLKEHRLVKNNQSYRVRVIVSIDDLDRCDPETVAEVSSFHTFDNYQFHYHLCYKFLSFLAEYRIISDLVLLHDSYIAGDEMCFDVSG